MFARVRVLHTLQQICPSFQKVFSIWLDNLFAFDDGLHFVKFWSLDISMGIHT